MGVWGLCPSGVQGQSPWSGGLGGEAPEAEHNYTFHQPIFAEFWCHFGKIQSFCKLLKLGLHVPWHKRCCFDKLMYVRSTSIGFTLRESTRYTIYSRPIMSITLQRYLWLRNTKYTHNNNHQQVRNNSYLTDRDKTGHIYRENSEISDCLFNSVNPSLHERCGCCSLLSGSR